jgi:hypothetical protein
VGGEHFRKEEAVLPFCTALMYPGLPTQYVTKPIMVLSQIKCCAPESLLVELIPVKEIVVVH